MDLMILAFIVVIVNCKYCLFAIRIKPALVIVQVSLYQGKRDTDIVCKRMYIKHKRDLFYEVKKLSINWQIQCVLRKRVSYRLVDWNIFSRSYDFTFCFCAYLQHKQITQIKVSSKDWLLLISWINITYAACSWLFSFCICPGKRMLIYTG